MNHELQELPGHSGVHPTSAALEAAADILDRVFEHSPGVFSEAEHGSDGEAMAFMSMVRPAREVMRPECGTYACFAGWYMMGRELARGSVEEVTFCEDGSDDSYVRFRIDGMLRDLHYEGGVLRLATDLGFDEGSELTEWAAHNPDLWGNRHGGGMFSTPYAFDVDVDEDAPFPVSTFVEHLRAVAERVRKWEARA